VSDAFLMDNETVFVALLPEDSTLVTVVVLPPVLPVPTSCEGENVLYCGTVLPR